MTRIPRSGTRNARPPLRTSTRWGGLPARPHVTSVQPYEVHSLEFGSGDETVVLVHGLSGSALWWSRNVQALAARYRVLVPDLIGFGRTRLAGPLPTIARVAELLTAWMDALDLGPVHLVGHSMGGQISVHLAATFPERLRKLVLVDSAGIPRPLHPRALVRAAFSLVPPRTWGNPLFLPTIAGDALSAGPRTLIRATSHILRDDVRPLLPSIQAPTLVLWGERDTIVPVDHAREFHRMIPDAKLVILRGAAHNAMVDRPRTFNRLVLRFLRGEDLDE